MVVDTLSIAAIVRILETATYFNVLMLSRYKA